MEKCLFCFLFVFATFVTGKVVPEEDVCELCVPLSKCLHLTSMSKKDQDSWKRKYPCNNNHPDDYGTGPGSNTQGDFICCPNQIWGMEPTEQSNQLTENKFGSSQDTPDKSVQSQYLSYDNARLNNSEDNNLLNDKQKNTNSHSSQIQETPSDNVEPSRRPTRHNYWNQRPDTNAWDIGNQNFYHGNNRLFNNRRNPYSNEGAGRSNEGGRQDQFNRRPNDQRYGQNNFDNQYANYPSNRQGNTVSQPGQCDRLTSFPPDPQSGCCGREATDDDRITGSPFIINSKNQLETKLTKTIDDPQNYDNFAPTYNNGGLGQDQSLDYEWPFSMFKEGTNITAFSNKTVAVVNGSRDADKVAVETRISGGKETEFTQFPWTLLLLATFVSSTEETGFNCGGSLISSRFVLTAGHCVYDSASTLKSVEVFLAEFDKRTFPRDCKLTGEGRKCIDNIAIYSENVVLHPRFDEARLLNDIALIKLQSDAPYTEYIRPICLPSINIDSPEHNRLPLTVAGWGRNGQYKTDIKQSTTVHLVPQHDCKKFYPDLTTRHLCAAGYSGEDTCKGDSGGPLMVLYQRKYYVVGVVSGKRTDAPCGSTVPTLYTNVYHYLDWISSNIAN